ncbi:hypothetical protein L226DRAFT_504721 [Lentinus tigrinus ALCF2SS1-7]|uniref:LysM domain-containing protein n=1 Tax=Lentinus tigrinus ALCF2SS1-6 TaxID=1328759 RepID=A0A5C2RPZ0_9APHY|nr:hypothetical protein L227DRAFT_535644 [Lentinus tigrinus ALCF2SS1-6]RPD76828.1 hypothetical protein L226DRAFT_504721 [Lentinus tigrinus ALCF2SS1-7]
MGRWTQYDEDSYRLPEGMKRVGYDSDTGKYYYRNSDGSLWEGAEGAQYGELNRVSHAPIAIGVQEEPSDEEAEIGSRADGYTPLPVDANGTVRHTGRSDSAYRMILPFFLMIAVVLLLVIRLVHSTTTPNPPEAILCPGSSEVYYVSRGDTCWDLAQAHGCSVDDILNVNRDLRCESLRPGEAVCLPKV